MRSNLSRRWLLPLIVLLLNGCVLVPGSNIDSSALEDDTSWFETGGGTWFPGLLGERDETDEEALQTLVNIVPINEQTVREQVEQDAFTRDDGGVPAAMPAELRQQIRDYQYRVSPGDILSITVYEHPELTNPAGTQRNQAEAGNVVDNDGTIFFPYVGRLNVDDMTPNEIREAISGPLSEYINNPQVDVKVLSYRSKRAYVTGQVSQPGPQTITDVPLTVMDAIAAAGGLTENANWHDVLLSRDGQDLHLSVHQMLNNGHMGQNHLLRHGDVLHVPELGDQQVFVLGELNDVSMLPMGNIRMSLTEALTRAGGLNQVTSNASGIFVIRQAPEGNEQLATIYQLNVRNAINFAVGTRFMLEPMDIVYVTTAPVTRWNRVISQIMPSVTALLTVERLTDVNN